MGIERGQGNAARQLSGTLNQGDVPAVHAICEDVPTRGLEAILDYNQRFDGGTRDDDIRRYGIKIVTEGTGWQGLSTLPKG